VRKAELKQDGKDWTIVHEDGSPVMNLFFKSKRNAQKVLDALVLVSQGLSQEEQEKPFEVPNSPEFHESVQAVKGQEPRRI
jgi:hypothetical protein